MECRLMKEIPLSIYVVCPPVLHAAFHFRKVNHTLNFLQEFYVNDKRIDNDF